MKEQIIVIIPFTLAVIYLLSVVGVFKHPVSVPSQLDDTSTYLELINEHRASKGLNTLRLSDKLNSSAQLKANDMESNRYFQHTSPDGVEPWHWFRLAGYDYEKSGEVLAKNYTTPEATVKAWIASPTHNAVLLGDYIEVGLGSVYSLDDHYIVGHFGK